MTQVFNNGFSEDITMRNPPPTPLCLLLSSLLIAACSQQRDSDNGGNPSGAMVRPTGERYNLKGSEPSGQFALSSSGLAKSQLVIDLTAAPAAVNSWAPSTCYTQLPGDFVIGTVTCATDPSKSAPITAANARQVCPADAAASQTQAPTPVAALDGCGEATITAERFMPPLGIWAIDK